MKKYGVYLLALVFPIPVMAQVNWASFTSWFGGKCEPQIVERIVEAPPQAPTILTKEVVKEVIKEVPVTKIKEVVVEKKVEVPVVKYMNDPAAAQKMDTLTKERDDYKIRLGLLQDEKKLLDKQYMTLTLERDLLRSQAQTVAPAQSAAPSNQAFYTEMLKTVDGTNAFESLCRQGKFMDSPPNGLQARCDAYWKTVTNK